MYQPADQQPEQLLGQKVRVEAHRALHRPKQLIREHQARVGVLLELLLQPYLRPALSPSLCLYLGAPALVYLKLPRLVPV